MGTGEVRVRDSVRRSGAGDRGDRGILALPAGLRCALIPFCYFGYCVSRERQTSRPLPAAGNANEAGSGIEVGGRALLRGEPSWAPKGTALSGRRMISGTACAITSASGAPPLAWWRSGSHRDLLYLFAATNRDASTQ